MMQFKTITPSLTLLSVAITSCTAVDHYSGETKTSNTVKGTAIGALGGGLIGAAIGNNRTGGSSRKYAIRGAVAGALVGAGVGHYMDQQEAQIREQLQGSGVSVSRDGDDLILNMPSDITFNVNSSQLQQQFASTLYSVALVVKKYTKTHLNIIGHTDSDGSHSHNFDLSIERANSVASYLDQSGVDSDRLKTLGKGETAPVASNATESGKAKNRRVVITIEPIAAQF